MRPDGKRAWKLRQGAIVAANIPDLIELPRSRAEPDDDVTWRRTEEFSEALAEQAEGYDVLLVNLYSEPVEDDLMSDHDGFHPHNEKHREIADHFLEAVLPALGLTPPCDAPSL